MPFEYSRKEQARIDNGEKVFPHIMGTDNLGRDYCIRVIYGTRISLMVGFVAALIVVIIGIIYGSISGYFGGRGRYGDDAHCGHHLFLAGCADRDSALGGHQRHYQHLERFDYPVGLGMISIFIVFLAFCIG